MSRKEQSGPERAPPKRGGNGSVHAAPPTQDVAGSAGLRDRLLQEIAETVGEEELAIWAKQAGHAFEEPTDGRRPSRGGGLSGPGGRRLRGPNDPSHPCSGASSPSPRLTRPISLRRPSRFSSCRWYGRLFLFRKTSFISSATRRTEVVCQPRAAAISDASTPRFARVANRIFSATLHCFGRNKRFMRLS